MNGTDAVNLFLEICVVAGWVAEPIPETPDHESADFLADRALRRLHPAAKSARAGRRNGGGGHRLGLPGPVAEARRRYEAALQAQRELDWAGYGEEMRQLGELLERLGPGRSEQQR